MMETRFLDRGSKGRGKKAEVMNRRWGLVVNSATDRLKSKTNSVRAWQFPIPHLCKYPDGRAKKDNHMEKYLPFTSGYFLLT